MRLNQTIRIYRPSRTPDGAGGYVEALALRHTSCAHVRAITARELVRADQLGAVGDYEITVRRSAATAATLESDIVEWQGRRLQVRGVLDNGPGEPYLVLLCQRGVAL